MENGVRKMKITDVTGSIKNGMWSYGYPFPEYRCVPLKQPEWVKAKVWCEVFGGLNSQTGTYLETPAHYFGPSVSYDLEKVPIEKLIDVRASHIKLDPSRFRTGRREYITVSMLEEYSRDCDIREGDALIFSCGWGDRWFDKSYLEQSPIVSKEAMEWLISKKPFILSSDVPRWDSLEKSEDFWQDFYSADILMLCPLVGLEKIGKQGLSLTVLPLNVSGTSCAPCRAFIKENI